ncbi:Alpha/Beta hydrolase protein [Usnea florida]
MERTLSQTRVPQDSQQSYGGEQDKDDILEFGAWLLPKSNITTLHSPINGNITIRFRSPPAGTCTTAFAYQKQYTGYVSLPPFTLAPIQQNYSINTFFWFVEARTNASTAPLTIYINGGPGSSSMVGLFQENGPCQVVEIAQGKLGTHINEWGWDRSSNILYVDQPNQAGFSFDTPTNGSLNLFTSIVSEPASNAPSGQPSYTFLNGTFSSNNDSSTANTTQIAAHAIWHMLQGFLGAFPQYNPGTYSNSTKPGAVGVNLFAESYGGKYGPAFATLWEHQNLLRKNGSIPSNGTLDIHLSSLGIMQGCVDDLVQGKYYPIFANNNTYGIQALSLVDQQAAASSFLSANGCQQLIQSCRDVVSAQDPQNDGDVANVNQICANAQNTCNNEVLGPYYSSGRDVYDITQVAPDPFPPSTYLEYLNNADVQAAIGVAVNYSQTSTAVAQAFLQTGDYERGDHIGEMAYLLSKGVRVALVYGDRDYICNWFGGEAISFSIAAQAAGYSPFYTAGYADIVINTTYVGGVVRQYGNLSFSRIYDAGHLIPAYQPETAFTVFTRIISGTDISLGEAANLSTYTSNGTANATETSKAPDQLEPTCWVRNIENTCTSDQKVMLQQGQGVIINGVLYNEASDWKQPPSSVGVMAGYPGTYPTSSTTTGPAPSEKGSSPSTTSVVLTGVFTATSTPSPKPSKGAASSKLFA